MSAFNNNNNSPLNSSGLQDRTNHLASTGIADDRRGQLNENHGIAATGLNEPHTHPTVPATQGITAERRHGDDLNYSGPPVPDSKVDQAGFHNPSSTNRTAATGIPPVNTAEHARQNAAQEALGGHNLTSNNRHHTAVGGTGPISTGATGATGTGAIGASGLVSGHHNKSTGVTTGDHHHNSTGLTGDNHHHGLGVSGTGVTGASGPASGHHDKSTGLTGDHHHNPNKEHHLGGGSTALGDHGASHHNKHNSGVGLDERAARIGTDATHPSGATATHDGQRHAGVPQHAGFAHGYNKEHHATTGGHPTTTSDVDGKPSIGDKIKGNVEKLAGKITGNEAKVVKGENIATDHTSA